MNKENIKKWTDALRSGQYEQTQRRLANCDRSAFCCMGVACEVAIKDGANVPIKIMDDGDVLYDSCYGIMPPSVRNYLGWQGPTNKLMDMNDEECKTFNEIADYIDSLVAGT